MRRQKQTADELQIQNLPDYNDVYQIATPNLQ